MYAQVAAAAGRHGTPAPRADDDAWPFWLERDIADDRLVSAIDFIRTSPPFEWKQVTRRVRGALPIEAVSSRTDGSLKVGLRVKVGELEVVTVAPHAGGWMVTDVGGMGD